MKRGRQTSAFRLFALFAAAAAILVGLPVAKKSDAAPKTRQMQKQSSALALSSEPIPRTWTPPDPSRVPAGAKAASILLGMRIFTETPKYASAYVGNQLSCGDCHLQGGTMSYGIALVGAPAWFPMFSERAKRDITLEDRIQECVTRSESGTPLPRGGAEVNALLDYFEWISQAAPPAPVRGLASMPELEANAARGAAVYKEHCAACHGEDGGGVPGILPALWGPNAYNEGAGMNQVKKMAAFVLRNMPQNKPGTLSPQQAYDVSAYVASKPHSAYNRAYDVY